MNVINYSASEGSDELRIADEFFSATEAECQFCGLSYKTIKNQHNAKRFTPKGKLKKNALEEIDNYQAKQKLIHHVLERHYDQEFWGYHVKIANLDLDDLAMRASQRKATMNKINHICKAFSIDIDTRHPIKFSMVTNELHEVYLYATGYCGYLRGDVRLNMLFDAATLNMRQYPGLFEVPTTIKEKADDALRRMQSILMEDAEFWAGNGVYTLKPIHPTGEFMTQEELSA